MMLLLAEVVDLLVSFVETMAAFEGVKESLVVVSLDSVIEVFVKRRLDELVDVFVSIPDLLSKALTLNSAVLSKKVSNTAKLLFC